MTRLPQIGILLSALICVGCESSDSSIAPVEGTVTMDGKPLPFATVLFLTGTSRPAGGMTDEQGHYFLTYTQGRQGALVGKNEVRISTVRDPGETAEGKKFPGSGETVPAMYNVQSTLEFVVEPGKVNVANFDLDSTGPLPETDDEDEPAGEELETPEPSAPEAEPSAPEAEPSAPETQQEAGGATPSATEPAAAPQDADDAPPPAVDAQSP